MRLATPADGAAIAAIYAPYVEETPISFETEVPDGAEMSRRVSTGSLDHPWLIAEASRPLGYAYGAPHRCRAAYKWSVDVSVYIDREHHRSGLGRRLYTCLLDLLRLQGYYTAFAGVTLPNDASMVLHRALGFELVGTYENVGFKSGRWHDVAWWQRELRPPSVAPSAPLTLQQAETLPEWNRVLDH